MWKDLSMKDKASYIRMGVENGITDLDTIREVYNKFADGGPIKKSNYYYANSDTTDPNFTDLTPIGEGVYKNKFGKVVYDTTKVTPPEKDKSINDNWQTAYAKGIPSGTMASDMETMNAVTGGALNWTMPSQLIGATGRLINDEDFGQFGRNLILGNSGIVTDKFAQEHPYLSMATNIAGDGVILGLAGAGRTGIKNSSNYVKQGIKNIKPFIKDVSVNYKDYLNDIKYLPQQTIKAIKDGRYTPFMTRQQAKIALRKNQEVLQNIFDDAYDFNKKIEANKSFPIDVNEQYKSNIGNWDKAWESDNIGNLNDSPYKNDKPTLHIDPIKTNVGQKFYDADAYYSNNDIYIPSRIRTSKHILIDPNSLRTRHTLSHEINHHMQDVIPKYRNIGNFDENVGYYVVNENNDLANKIFAPIKKNSLKEKTNWSGSPYEVQSDMAGLKYILNNPANYSNQPWYNKLYMKHYISKHFNISSSEANKMLNDMSRHSFAIGGPIKKSYKDFSTRLSKAWNNEDLSKHDYDYQKYYNDDPEEAYRQLESIEHGGTGHFPDEGRSGIYKTPNHPTYPDLDANSWLNDDKIFNMSARQAVPENTDRVLDYLGSDLDYNRGATKVIYDGAYQLPEVTATPNGNYTELIPNELGTGWMYRDRAGRFDDVDYSYLDNYLGNKKALGGILYKDGGYKPSSSIKKRISNWEGSSMKTNRSFEAEARDFNASLPKGATSKLSQTQLDGLYSYSYNVGAGNFRKRVNPVLTRYLAGQATIQDVQRAMWASKDNQLRGLANRRNIERSMLGSYTPMDFGPLSNTTTMMINHYLPETEPIEIPQLQFNDVINTPKPIELESSTPYSSSDIDFSDPNSSLANVLDMIQMIRRPRKINIYT